MLAYTESVLVSERPCRRTLKRNSEITHTESKERSRIREDKGGMQDAACLEPPQENISHISSARRLQHTSTTMPRESGLLMSSQRSRPRSIRLRAEVRDIIPVRSPELRALVGVLQFQWGNLEMCGIGRETNHGKAPPNSMA